MRALPVLVTVAVLLSGCGTPRVTGSASAAATPSPGYPVTVSGDPETGVSPPFMLSTLVGSDFYMVEWTATADIPGCAFSLSLLAQADGLPVGWYVRPVTLPETRAYSGSDVWDAVSPGTYVLQEDRFTSANCKGPWSATLTNATP